MSGGASCALVDDLEAVFLDDWIGEDFLRDALELLPGFVTIPAVQVEDEEFALADIFDGGVAEAGQGVVDGLSLGIEHGALRHDPDVCFHARSIASGKCWLED